MNKFKKINFNCKKLLNEADDKFRVELYEQIHNLIHFEITSNLYADGNFIKTARIRNNMRLQLKNTKWINVLVKLKL